LYLLEPPPSRFDLRFHLFGTPVRVHPMFWLITGLLFLAVNRGVLSAAELVLWVLSVFVSILLHEYGHVFAGRLFGRHGHIVLFGFGGLAVGSSQLPRRWQRIVVYLAGPAAQLLLYGALRLLDGPANADPRLPYLQLLLIYLLFINLWWPLLNLLPIWPLDGGQVARDLCTGLSPRRGLWWSLLISGVTATVFALNALASHLAGRPFLPYLPAGGLYTAIFFGLFAYSSFLELAQAGRGGGGWREPSDRYPWER
jgi:Zn-dependent protease